MSIYLLRHGETDWNVIDRLQGHTDIPLNEQGRKRIEHVALVFKNDIGDVDCIISSPLKRACESAEIFSGCIGYKKQIIIEESFIERHFGLAEGLLIEEIKQLYPDFVFPGMESETDVYLRTIEGLNFYCDKYPGSSILFRLNKRDGRYQIEEILVS